LGIVASGTRAGLAGLAIGAFVTFLFLRPRLSRRAALASFIGVVALSAFYYSPSGQKLRARVRWYTEDPAGGPRLLMWRDSARMFARYWPAGSGPETFSLVFPRFQSAELSSAYPDFYHESPHNFLLDAATSQGIPGVALLLAMCSLAYFAALRSSVENRTLAGILAGGLSGVITAHLFTSFIVPTLLGFYLLIAMMVLLDAGGVRSQAAPRPRWIVAAAASPLAVLLIVYAWRLLSADRSLALAREHLEAGRILEARLSYERSIRLHPRGAVADLWYSRAMALAAQKSDQPARRLLAWQEGIEAARRATQSSDDRHNAWYNVAAFYASQNDFGRTEQSLRSAIGCSPNWFKPHWMLARVLREAGRLPEAIAEAQIAAKLNGGKNQEVRATLELLLASNSGAEKKK
jgi:tetratricopeptide (TPR) repeat protein